jgi:hypothetical protein
MKHWEEAGLLTDLLDRHLQRLAEATQPNDWTIFWALPPFLHLLKFEPVLAALVDDYMTEVGGVYAARDRRVRRLLRSAEMLAAEHERELAVVREAIDASKREGLGFDRLPERIEQARADLSELAGCERVLDCLHQWIGFDYRAAEDEWGHATLADAQAVVGRLRNQLKRLSLQLDRFSASHPGEAYMRLTGHVIGLNYAATDDVIADEVRNREVARVRGNIREAEMWGDSLGGIPQPAIIGIQRDANRSIASDSFAYFKWRTAPRVVEVLVGCAVAPRRS